MKLRPKALPLVAAAALASSLLIPGHAAGATGYDPTDPTQKAEHDAAYATGVDAYKFGLPLLDMDRLFRTYRSVNVCNEVTGYGPVNTFCHGRRLVGAQFRDVVAPNSDTNYSIATLNLPADGQPMVLSIPQTPDHYHVFELLDMWTTNFANIGDAIAKAYPDPTARPFAHPDGDYIVVGPGQLDGKLDGVTTYRGLPVIHADTNDVWVIGRTILKSPDDLPFVHALQDSYHVIPLNKYGKDWTPKAPSKIDDKVDTATIPGTKPGEDPIAYFDALGDQLARYAPYAADAPMLDRLHRFGIGVGLHPSATEDAATLAGLRDAVTAGPASVDADVRAMAAAGFSAHNGWLAMNTGSYGTDYRFRAVTDKIGLGALDGRVATYPVAQTDRTGQLLTATKRYVAHFAPGTFPPPADGFWSLTMYDANMFLVDNELDRYVLNDRSDLHVNPDGSLDLYLQATRPTDPEQVENWLPAPAAGDATNPTQRFNLIMRLYSITPSRFDGVISGSGWVPPTILPCDATGHTVTGWTCAG
ncbi:MAG TPA: DUF1254 domain-containing protein [Nocardioides sp.]|nr:DUF1254 domain-containing protein [Nocardioides sp.]